MSFTKPFSGLSKKDAGIAGGKGASLGEMTQVGISVPPGFVILSNTFERFLEEVDLIQEINAILKEVDHKAIHTVEGASEKIRGLIDATDIPEDISKEVLKSFVELKCQYVAVRSSATAEDGAEHAWAGQLESYLNTTEKDLLENVRKCWSSLFTPRAIFYRFEKELHGTDISVAVVVQKMVQSETSGIAFSVHPITEDRNQLIIEAGYGLGEAIVSGSVTPDSYVIEKEPRKIVDINVNTQTKALYKSEDGNKWQDISEPKASSQVLNESQILELADLVIKIENHYGFPCDIEWAYEAGEFCITQSRPITTLSPKVIENKLVFEKSITRDWGLIYAELWHYVFTQEFRKQIDWAYTEVVFEGKDGTISINRAPAEHIDGMRQFILSCLDEDEKWIHQHASSVKKQVDDVIIWGNKIREKSFDTYTKEELLSITNTFWEKNTKLGPAFIMMFWFPIQMEKYPDADKYKKAVEEAIQTRAEVEKIGPFADEFGRLLALEVAKRAHVPADLSKFVSIKELISYLESGNPIDTGVLNRRKEYLIVTNEGVIHEPITEYLSRHGYQFRRERVENIKEIKGNCAYPGILVGKVRVIKKKADFDKLQNGDVLVTGMTTPDFLPLMKKAAAFVTDEGGITCHAAIVAREMKKPCVIGTKIATEAFKDGDEVEIDAERGMVRLVKSA